MYCSPACQRADWHEHKPRCEHVRSKMYGGTLAFDDADDGVAISDEDVAQFYADLGPADDSLVALLCRSRSDERALYAKTALRALAVEHTALLLANGRKLGVSPMMPVGQLGRSAHARGGKRRKGGAAVTASMNATLLGTATFNCTHRWPPELAARALGVWRLLVEATPVAVLDSPDCFPAVARLNDSTAEGRVIDMRMLEFVVAHFHRDAVGPALAVLVAKGVDVNATGPIRREQVTQPYPPLCVAALMGATAATMGVLLDAGAHVNDSRIGCSALHVLAGAECPDAAEKVRLLVACGADIEARDSAGRTPLAAAVDTDSIGSLRVFDVLLSLGADARALMDDVVLTRGKDGAPDVHGCCLHAAARANDTAMLRRMLAPELRRFVDVDAPARARDDDDIVFSGSTPLHVAALAGRVGGKGRPGAIELLVAAGADVSAVNDGCKLMTPLDSSIIGCQPEAARLLLQLGAAPVGSYAFDASMTTAKSAANWIQRQHACEGDVPSWHGGPRSLPAFADTAHRVVRVFEEAAAAAGDNGGRPQAAGRRAPRPSSR